MSLADYAEPGGRSWRQVWLGIDTDERAVAFASTRAGGAFLALALVVIIAGTQMVSNASLALIAVTLLAIQLLPARRLAVVAGASTFFFAMRPYRIEEWAALQSALSSSISVPALWLQTVCVLAFLTAAYGFLAWQKRNLHLTAAKRPVLTLIVGWLTLFAAALAVPAGHIAHAPIWIVLGIAISAMWYLAYAAVDQKVAAAKPTGIPTLARAGMMRPFWGGSALPIGKSYGYLSKFDARTAEELGVTRLKAVKLAVWALWLTLARWAVEAGIYDWAGVAPLEAEIAAHASGQALDWASYAAVLMNYGLDLLIIAIWGHAIVAVIRMCGWRVPRNTRNPLASRTLAEFWNRYFFYFKELLVDFFFYPAFLRWFKNQPKLRIAFATFCAAGAGNFLYHFMRETHHFATKPVAEVLPIFQSAMFYSLVLALGLIVSQWRGRKAKPEDGFFRWHVWPRLNVMAFFCFLKIFDDVRGEVTFGERIQFTAALFGA